jgi:hypothetical protein
MLPASAVPESVGVVALVTSSEDETPVSGEIPEIVGVFGAVVSIVKLYMSEIELILPATSLAAAVNA